jgi:hypothetical protein
VQNEQNAARSSVAGGVPIGLRCGYSVVCVLLVMLARFESSRYARFDLTQILRV